MPSCPGPGHQHTPYVPWPGGNNHENAKVAVRSRIRVGPASLGGCKRRE